ncbi:MAG: methyl-accepting chemotaxis protein [Lachnospiraceae bacterium]|nr:methyl-accepting chemotaxis protein [Lachnospiraceae bacterium]
MKEKKDQKNKRSFGIMQRIVAIAIGPIIVLSIVLATFSSVVMRRGMEDEAINRLEDIVIGVEQVLSVTGEGEFHSDGKDLYKGEHDISENLGAYEAFASKAGVDITLFWGDTRMITTLIDEKTGERMVGTKASDYVIQMVLKDGKSYTDKDIKINGKPYFCCYIPLKNDDGSIAGMIFAGEPSSGIEDYINNKMIQIILVAIAIIILGCFEISLLSRRIARAFQKEEDIIKRLAEGNLNIEVEESLLARTDEIGSIAEAIQNLVQTLAGIINHIQQSSNELVQSGQSLDEMAERVNANATEISKAVEEISMGAVSQAEEIETASGQIMDMGAVIENIVEDVDKLNSTSRTMKEAGDTSTEIMRHLVASTDRTNQAIKKIGAQIYATNESAQKIREAVDIISSIASQTSLLSLNASIEAARAGEFGKGFAVVASEIQKLADESSNSAQTITDVINSLLADSEMTVEIMKEVEEIIKDQRKKLDATQSNFVNVTTGINSSREDTSMIEKRTRVCDSSRKTVVDVISNLSALSQENAASAQETTASMEELNATINLLADAANSLRGLSDQMEEEMKFFKL